MHHGIPELPVQCLIVHSKHMNCPFITGNTEEGGVKTEVDTGERKRIQKQRRRELIRIYMIAMKQVHNNYNIHVYT